MPCHAGVRRPLPRMLRVRSARHVGVARHVLGLGRMRNAAWDLRPRSLVTKAADCPSGSLGPGGRSNAGFGPTLPPTLRGARAQQLRTGVVRVRLSKPHTGAGRPTQLSLSNPKVSGAYSDPRWSEIPPGTTLKHLSHRRAQCTRRMWPTPCVGMRASLASPRRHVLHESVPAAIFGKHDVALEIVQGELEASRGGGRASRRTDVKSASVAGKFGAREVWAGRCKSSRYEIKSPCSASPADVKTRIFAKI